jgi:predicted small lipoprotein YifL
MRPTGVLFHISLPLSFIIFVCLLSLPSCGKKGPLTLSSYEKPEAPTLLTLRHREDKIILSWSFPREKEKEIAGFLVMRSSGGEFEKIGSGEQRMRTFVDSDVISGTRLRYKILSQNLRGILSKDSNIMAITPSPGPVPPRSFSVRLSDDFLELSWENIGKGILYKIYRSFKKEVQAPVPLNAAPLSATVFRDSFFSDRRVYYTIRSLSPNLDEGSPSQQFTVDPALFVPPAPRELHCFARTDRAYLYWNEADSPLIKGFRVYRKFGSGEYEFVGETQIPLFLDPDSPSRRRDYRVTAVGPSGEGQAAEILDACGPPE